MESSYKYYFDSKSGEGYRYPRGFTSKDFESALKYKATERDIFVCTFPKSGTTWVQNILWLMFNDGVPFSEDIKLRSLIPFLEFDGHEASEYTDDGVKPHLMKTHFPYKLIPQHPNAKYVFVIRNPKDMCVSLYYHIKGFSKYYNFDSSFSEFFEEFMKGNTDVGDYFKINNEYYSLRNNSNVLLLLYEDLKQDPRKEILKIAKFLGNEHYERLSRDNDYMERVLLHSSFEYMHKEHRKFASERPQELPFIRKGVVGDWKNILTEEQSRRINETLQKYEMKELWTEEGM